MGILYLSLSPYSPFNTDPPPAPPTPPINSTLPSPQPLTLPIPNRGWITWNNGRIFDPPLIGYQPNINPDSAIDSSTSSSQEGEIPKDKMSLPLPSNYVDLSFHKGLFAGLGFVIDFGLARSEEGLRWEGEIGQLPPPSPRSPISIDSTDSSSSADPSPHTPLEPLEGDVVSKIMDAQSTEPAKTPRTNRGWFDWRRVPFYGDL